MNIAVWSNNDASMHGSLCMFENSDAHSVLLMHDNFEGKLALFEIESGKTVEWTQTQRDDGVAFKQWAVWIPKPKQGNLQEYQSVYQYNGFTPAEVPPPESFVEEL